MRLADPGLFALKGAVRAAVTMPVVFAVALVALDSQQAAVFAAFGTMALLVFTDFGGPWRSRLLAYALLSAAGVPLIAIGTLCSESTPLAVGAMAVVGFAILFAGVLNGYAAAAQVAAILAFVLPVMIPAGADQLPARLLGWAMAAVASTAAALLVWPRRPQDEVAVAAARAARSLAELVAARSDAKASARSGAREAILAARERSIALQHRPSGTGGRPAELARLIDDLGWLWGIAAGPAAPEQVSAPFASERVEIERLVPVVLRIAAERVEGRVDAGSEDPGLAALDRAHEALGRAVLARFRSPGLDDEAAAAVELADAYRLRALAYGTAQAAMLAAGVVGGGEVDGDPATVRAELGAAEQLASAHATLRSVWLRNSLRGAVGLAAAVLVGQVADVQNAFWVVLGTISVLRSDALGTGATVIQALLGTLAGIVVGGALMVAVGDTPAVLWAALPAATLLAAYTPRAISFAAGQAGFSFVVLILFNLIEPAGWKVGLVRVEDVAIGAAVSVVAGALLWPRGAAPVLRRTLGAAFDRTAAYLGATIESLLGRGSAIDEAAREAFDSIQVLDATVRDYLGERSSARASIDDLAILAAGATRIRRVTGLLEGASVLAPLVPIDESVPRLAEAEAELRSERDSSCEWFERLGRAIATRGSMPAPEADHEAEPGPPAVVLPERPGGADGVPPGLAIAWTELHLESLSQMEPALARAGERLAPSADRGRGGLSRPARQRPSR